MPHSEGSSKGDRRFRIPRGESDEEIDSDLASLPSPSPPSPSLSPTAPLVATSKPPRDSVTKTANSLTVGLASLHPSSHTAHPLSDNEDGISNGEDDDIDDDNLGAGEPLPSSAALESITAAATRRNLRLSDARRVDPTSLTTAPRAPVAPAEDAPSHPSMMTRILDTLRASATETGAPITSSLPVLHKKVARLHNDKKSELAVPLPAPVSARLERVEAYGQAKHQVSEKWGNTVGKLRRAETLVFPLNERRPDVTTANIAARPPAEKAEFAAEHEREIADILEKAGVGNDGGVARGEEKVVGNILAAGKITKEDVLRRQGELARVRSLMFHYDQKMKRIKKIKSKKFRRLMKKERERLDDAELAADPAAQLEEALAAERRRVEERVTLRHKNTSKWIRRQLQRGEGKRDADTRAAIEDQLRLHEELKRRQNGESRNRDSDSDDESLGDDADPEARENDELEKLEEEIRADGSDGEKQRPKKGVMSMRFMQAAEEKKRKEALALLKEMRENNGEDGDVSDEEEVLVGRKSFSGTAQNSTARSPKSVNNTVIDDDDECEEDADGIGEISDDVDISRLEKRVRKEYLHAEVNGAIGDKSDGLIDVEAAAEAIRSANGTKTAFVSRLDARLKPDDDFDDNPWLNGFDSRSEKVTAKKVKPEVPDSSVNVTIKKRAHNNAMDSEKKKLDESDGVKSDSCMAEGKRSKRRRRHDVEQPISDVHNCTNTPSIPSSTPLHEMKMAPKNKNAIGSSRVATGQENGTINGDFSSDDRRNVDESADIDYNGNMNDSDDEDLSRMEMVAEAFAGAGGADQTDFEKAKEADVEKNLPTAKLLNAEVLPGWGRWHGAGMSKEQKKNSKETPFARAARERLQAARQNAVKSRSDRNMRHVILEQKRYQSATKLTLGSVPYPYQSREEWERELSRPLCRELVSNKSFSGDVRPRVQARLGKVLGPIEEPLVLGDSKNDGQLLKRSRGKKGVIELRKEKSTHRVKARRGFLS